MLNKDRAEWLTYQYVCAIQNNAEWHGYMQKAVECKNFGQFQRITSPFIQGVSKNLQRSDMGLTVQQGIEWAFIYKALWDEAGGDRDFLMREGENYVALLHEEERSRPQRAEETFEAEYEANFTTTEENQIMAKVFEQKSYIFGQDTSAMSEEQLIESIKKIEAEIGKLKEVKTESTKIASKIAELEAALVEVVAILDAK
jgi:hypothetical protein